MLNKKLLAAAVVGALFAGNAVAADLSAPGGAVPAYFAKEIIASVAAPVELETSASAATSLNWETKYNFSEGEVRYFRVQASDNLRFDAGTTVLLNGVASATVGAINGTGTNAVTFSITAPAGGISSTDVLTLVGDHSITSTASNVTVEVSLYDNPSQAQIGGTGAGSGRILGADQSGAYLSFVNSIVLTADTRTATADVEADPAFTSFLPETGVATLSTAFLADVSYGITDVPGAQTAPFKIDGTGITLADLVTADTAIRFSGDFTPASSTGATPYDAAALGRVTLDGVSADALTGTVATFEVGNTPFDDYAFDLTRRTGAVIYAADYTATLVPVAAQPTVYAVATPAAVASGKIVRNGTELQAPLAQIPTGWITRLALTNTGGIERAYTIELLSEEGVTLTTANLTGTVPASGTRVIDLSTVLTGSSAALRGTVVVNVAGPTGQIQGLYQIVNPATGALSNHVLVRPGTN